MDALPNARAWKNVQHTEIAEDHGPCVEVMEGIIRMSVNWKGQPAKNRERSPSSTKDIAVSNFIFRYLCLVEFYQSVINLIKSF